MADTPENIYSTGGPTNDTPPSSTSQPMPDANTPTDTTPIEQPIDGVGVRTYTNQDGSITETIPGTTPTSVPTTDPATDPFDTEYLNPLLSTEQVGIDQRGTVIPNDVEPYVDPLNLTDTAALLSNLMSSITSNTTYSASAQNRRYQGCNVIISTKDKDFAFPAIYIPFPQYLTFIQLQELASQILQNIQANPTTVAYKYETYGNNGDIINAVPFSAIEMVTVIGIHYDSLKPGSSAPVYT
jgi:hypothetical protein